MEAVQAGLVGLFARKFLPANPFPYLAEVVTGSFDQQGVWQLTARQVQMWLLHHAFHLLHPSAKSPWNTKCVLLL